MKNNGFIFIGLSLVMILLTGDAWADDVFDELAVRADNLGNNLKRVGYIIAGLGLIAFAVAAMFNKISWKTFTYIAISTFFLTSMTAAINWVSEPDGTDAVSVTNDWDRATEVFSGVMDLFSSGH